LVLGIHFAQFPELRELTDKQRLSESHEPLITEGKYVKGLSGMTCVLPAWTILEVLNMPKLRAQRDKLNDQYAAELQPKRSKS
jgi:hypothetical protein